MNLYVLTITEDDILLKGSRIVEPKKLQRDILRIAHADHQGMVKTTRLARRHVWFIGMDSMIESIVERCSKFGSASKMNPFKMRKFPIGSW